MRSIGFYYLSFKMAMVDNGTLELLKIYGTFLIFSNLGLLVLEDFLESLLGNSLGRHDSMSINSG